MLLTEAIASLGSTREEALAAMRARKIRCRSHADITAEEHGPPVSTSCLVATYLRACGVPTASCGAITATVSWPQAQTEYLPEHVSSIIRDYDMGDPALEEFYEVAP